MLDSTSLLTAVAIATTALMATLLLNWTSMRSDRFMLWWCAGLGLIVSSVVAFTQLSSPWIPALQLIAHTALIAGFAFIYLGARLFLHRDPRPMAILGFWALASMATGVCFVAGVTGLGVIIVNMACAILLFLIAFEYWFGRAEARQLMVSISAVYALTAISFAICAFELIHRGDFVLHAHPDNWAEDLNLLACMIALGSVGGMTLTVNQMRIARSHRVDAMTDALTGLPNRRALFDLAEHMDLSAGTAVIMFDLDHFKIINDRFGHALGDEVLQRFASVLSRSLRHGDIAARLGGEEFCVILSAREAVRAHDVANHIRIQFMSAPALSDDFGQATVSAGYAVSPDGKASLETLMHQADEALYAAKSDGRNHVRPSDEDHSGNGPGAQDTSSPAMSYVLHLTHRRQQKRAVEIAKDLESSAAVPPGRPSPRIAG